MMTDLAVAFVGDTPKALATAVRAGRWRDLRALVGADEADLGPYPALGAAYLALVARLPRVVVAPDVRATGDVAYIVVPGRLSEAQRARLLADRQGRDDIPMLLDLPEGVDLETIDRARTRGVFFCGPGGTFEVPGVPRAIPVGGAAMALPLLVAAPALGPMVALAGRGEEIVPPAARQAGAIGLVSVGPAARVTLAPGTRPPPPRRPTAEPPGDAGRGAGVEAALAAAFEDIARRHAFRYDPGPAGWQALRREAEPVLERARAAGHITGYALRVGPEVEGGGALIEAFVAVPRRVEQVIVRVGRLGGG